MPGIARGIPPGVTPWGRGDDVVVEAMFNGQVIARSNNTIVVEDNHYFPPQDVRMEYLTRSRAKTLCPWKGIASYYTVTVNGASDRNAAWTYLHPSPLARGIKNHIAFWHAVRIIELE
jgi:uncharacterized protein (DUF427 family)